LRGVVVLLVLFVVDLGLASAVDLLKPFADVASLEVFIFLSSSHE
jgi:hypothetical protein